MRVADLEDLIRRINRDMEEHRRQLEHCKQVDASLRAMAEQRRPIAELVGWLGYFRFPLALAAIAGIAIFWGPRRSS
jgi:hypothetical protein